MACLLDMPEEIIRYVSKFLMIEDVVRLSMTCKCLFHRLPTYSLEEKVIDMANLSTRAGKSTSHWTFDFETPPFTSCIFMATISATIIYEDYDFGNEGRNNIAIQLVRPEIAPNHPKIIMKEYIIREEYHKITVLWHTRGLQITPNKILQGENNNPLIGLPMYIFIHTGKQF